MDEPPKLTYGGVVPDPPAPCPLCGTAPSLGSRFCVNCGTRLFAPFIAAEKTPVEPSPEERATDRMAGMMCFIGAIFVAAGSFVPYVTITGTSAGLFQGVSLSRNAFQFGLFGSLNYIGPLILVGALYLVFDGLTLTRQLKKVRVRPFTPLIAAGANLVFILNAWMAHWTEITGLHVTRSPGGGVSLVGVLFAIGAFAVRQWRRRTTNQVLATAPPATGGVDE